MIARACKRYFFKTFHEIIKEKHLLSGEMLQDFKEYFIDFLNLLFIKSKEGEKFFRQHIYS